MNPSPPCVLTINAGSSSIRFAVFDHCEHSRRRLVGKIDRIGLKGTNLTVEFPMGKRRAPRQLDASDHRTAVGCLLDWLEAQAIFGSVKAVGHRVVHGMRHTAPERVTSKLLGELRRITPYDPDHLPIEIELIGAVRERHPDLGQVACFDTAFHRTMPPVAKILPIPRRYGAEGVERYGFHGLSYQYLMEELVRLKDPAATKGRVILAHLGNGASLAAVKCGESIDTSMGFTPAAGLVMSTRSGDLDPGLLSFLARKERMTPAQFDRMVNHESGMLGVSGTSPDMRDLLSHEARDARGRPAKAASLGLPLEAGAPASQSTPLNQAQPDPASLRICAAKKQPPLSLEDGSGLENKIGVALAEAMNLKAQFVWSDKPAIYLVRDFLDKSLCDIIVGLDGLDPRVGHMDSYLSHRLCFHH